MSLCLSVSLSFCLSVFLSLCLSVSLSFCLSVVLSFYLSVLLFSLYISFFVFCLSFVYCLAPVYSLPLFTCYRISGTFLVNISIFEEFEARKMATHIRLILENQGQILSVPKFTTNLYSICLSIPQIYT